MNTIAIVLVILLTVVSVFVGIVIGVGLGLDQFEKDLSKENDLFCFECEIEMPVKVKNGRKYCTSCGLQH